MKINYKYKDMTMPQFLLNCASEDVNVSGFGTMSDMENGQMGKFFYVEIVGCEDRFVLKEFEDEIKDEEKIEVGDTVLYVVSEFIVEDFDEDGFLIPKKPNELRDNIILINPEFCTLVKKATIDKDKKIENLQAIISKNYKKIENQANEITLLIQQKEDLKATLSLLIDEKLRIVNIAENKIEELDIYKRSFNNCMKEIERQKAIIDYLEDKLGLENDSDE
jgi:hypothetical protein